MMGESTFNMPVAPKPCHCTDGTKGLIFLLIFLFTKLEFTRQTDFCLLPTCMRARAYVCVRVCVCQLSNFAAVKTPLSKKI